MARSNFTTATELDQDIPFCICNSASSSTIIILEYSDLSHSDAETISFGLLYTFG